MEKHVTEGTVSDTSLLYKRGSSWRLHHYWKSLHYCLHVISCHVNIADAEEWLPDPVPVKHA